ncbi:hypothetical protein ACFQ5D_03355 [Paenibacillus farraposensis]|uniref:Uncharacterized protein n=1 Tax=Paenibacillus farraposensis TaxID=2807095 RepID=A0ABW4D9S1_9BACL|nr:hypothetical protein [Paenibacillus farraposensis]MCC3382088.1 hypothetical protein [Paenibacillus farraposensis]
MAALTEAQLRICAQACITRYDQGESDMAKIIGSYALDEKQREQVMKMIISNRSDLMLDNRMNSSSTEVSNKQEEKVKWYSSIFHKKTV